MQEIVTTSEVRQKFRKFFESKNHEWLPSASLVPENDATTLFIGSGMQPLLPYLLGQQHPKGNLLANSQTAFRAEDIDEVGDNRHTTFFEMLGNWSLGEYFKEEQLSQVFQFLVTELGLDPKRLYVTVFSGDQAVGIPRDVESAEIWETIFSKASVPNKIVDLITEADGYELGMQDGRIFYYDATKNWWSRSGPPAKMPAGEPGGPDSEMFYDFGTKHNEQFGKYCHPNCDCGRFIEIGNSVFMEYLKQDDGSFKSLPKKNVDFGGGLERITAAANDFNDIFEIDIFAKIFDEINKTYNLEYKTSSDEQKISLRIIADHVRAAVFMIGDGVAPGNTDQGSILRTLILRAVSTARILTPDFSGLHKLTDSIIDAYQQIYPQLSTASETIHEVFEEEEVRALKAMRDGEREILKHKNAELSGFNAYHIYSSHGSTVAMSKKFANDHNIALSSRFDAEVKEAMTEHSKASKVGSDKKFAGGLADHSDMSVKYHTATHLLHQALRDVLGEHVWQKGSNITPERLRFDFSHSEKMTPEQIKKTEDIVNSNIAANHKVVKQEMSVAEAKKLGALGLFEDKYQDAVSVYSIGDYSREICGGPHVEETKALGIFKIKKEESASSGVRRIKAVLE